MSSEAPFHIGQKVVSLVDSLHIKKGDQFEVVGIWKECCTWLVDVGLKMPQCFFGVCEHGHTLILHVGDVWPFDYKVLAPLQDQYADITSEIAKGVFIGDSADQPLKKVLEPVNN